MRERVDRTRLRAFMRALSDAARRPLQVYFVGGATAVLEGWREATIDVDLALGGDADAVLKALPAIKERLDVNVELASPADFIPVKPGWEDRSPFVAQEGPVTFRHFDLYAQALAKIERGHDRDRRDVRHMIEEGLVRRETLATCFEQIRPALLRYPALDPAAFAQRLATALQP
jgi:hypothetical protein